MSVAVSLAVMLMAFGAGKAFAYACGSHCYGLNTWSSSTEYYGAQTDISVVHLNCDTTTCAPSGLINEEMWLVDQTSCVRQDDGLCWIETGYVDYYSTNQTFFWADERPGQPFTFELMKNVSNSDYGNTDHFVIIKDKRVTPAGFEILVYNDSSTTLLEGTSNDNAMMGKQIIIGQELFGSGGASAPKAIFTHNLFAVQALGPGNAFVYNTQTIEGMVTSDNPPSGQWDTNPATSADGGQFSTSCC
jgi:hypothetical protein